MFVFDQDALEGEKLERRLDFSGVETLWRGLNGRKASANCGS